MAGSEAPRDQRSAIGREASPLLAVLELLDAIAQLL
jgi:hypothetical protein